MYVQHGLCQQNDLRVRLRSALKPGHARETARRIDSGTALHELAHLARDFRRGQLPCWRFRVPDGAVVTFDDVFAWHFEQDVSNALGDFPLARDEFGAGYTLACTVDDLLMGVTEVVRGDDLLSATPAQILLARALGAAHTISYCHVPLVVGRDGKRLAKRHGDTRISAYRAQGSSPEEILGLLAASCGWAADGERIALAELLPRFDLATIPHAPFMI